MLAALGHDEKESVIAEASAYAGALEIVEAFHDISIIRQLLVAALTK